MSRKKIPPTITKGVAKVPVIMQLEALECGAASLAMVMAYYGKWIPLEQVRADCGVSRNGSNAANIYKAAQNYGFEVSAYKISPEGLKNGGRFPCIIHWNMCHFVVLKGFKGNKVCINDPERGDVTISWDEFDSSFTGVCLIPVPSAEFKQEGSRKSTLAFAKKRLTGASAAVAFVMITTVIAYLFGIVDSVTSRIFMDRLLTGIDVEWLYPFVCILIMLAVIRLVTAWINAVYSLKISGKMAVIGSCSYMWKLLRLPMDFFSQRLVGDIQGRLALNASVAGTLVDTFAPLLINTVMMVFYLVLMIRQSPLLSCVGVAAVLINVFMSGVISDRRLNIERVRMRDEGKLQAATVSGIEMMETIKASGSEAGFFKKWAGFQASVNRQDVKVFKVDTYLGMIPVFFTLAANYAVLLLGVYLVMQGRFSLGSVLMFQGFLTSFTGPAKVLISAGQIIQEMRARMERVEDVMEYPDDPSFLSEKGEAVSDEVADQEVLTKLEGGVELKDVTFGYSRLAEPLVEKFSLSIKPGERIAIVGGSGCGKSTISKLISGLYQPWSGEILFDGRPAGTYPRDVLTSSIAVVDQDIILFEDTIGNNIRMWDESIEDFDVIMAAKDAQLHDDIMKMRGGYNHRIISGGRNLSGGQRQRMEIARVLAQDPTIIILDEATSALDARTEADVVLSIAERGITCIVIAHRLSTVRDCDRIIVLDNGHIVECGTHDELMKKNGEYAELVTSE